MSQLVQVSALPGQAYEVALAEGSRRQPFTVEVDDRHQVLGIEDDQAVADLVLAVHRARHEVVPVAGRALLRLSRIAALPDETYELLFDADGTSHRFVCEAHQHKGISYVTSEPPLTRMDPAYDGPDVGDPRLVVAVVLAMHRSRHR